MRADLLVGHAVARVVACTLGWFVSDEPRMWSLPASPARESDGRDGARVRQDRGPALAIGRSRCTRCADVTARSS